MVGPDTTAQMKIESGATEITDGITANIIWPENAVALAKIAAWNIDATNFIANLDTFDNLKIYFRYGVAAWTKYFDGIIEDANPILKQNNDQTVVCTAYGKGRALRNTHCNTSYGKESENPTIDTPGEIWTDLVDNYVEKSFGGAATGYTLGLAPNNGTLPTINHLFNPYRPCIDVLNETLLLIQAHRAGLTGHHWIVGTDGTLRVKRMGSDILGWFQWWNTNRAGSTLVEGTHFIDYSFSKRVRSKDFANKIILATDLRKPGYDYWTENQSALWGTTDANLTDSATCIVGSKSLLIEPSHAANPAYAVYPSAKNAAWDFTKIGSQNSPPTLNFYIRRNKASAGNNDVVTLYTAGVDGAGDYFRLYSGFNTHVGVNDKFVFLSLPIGLYHDAHQETQGRRWIATNGIAAADWANINWIEFRMEGGDQTQDLFIDDLHFTGKIIREAYNSTNITANDEHQKIVRMNSSVEDSMKQTDDSGMAARLAYAELLRAQTTPRVGTVKLYGIVDILPGQWVHIHAEKTNGTYRINDDFRVKQVQQQFLGFHEFYTTLSLTDDLLNTFAKGPAELVSGYYKTVFTDPEAQSLKTTGVDPLVPRLTIDYP